jgi:transcriptional regulator with XRE-family HTH domain
LKTIGDHIKKRRLDLKLLQREVAERFGVDETTVQFWENNRVKPSLALTPKIIEFLGYDPLGAKPISLGEKIRHFRRLHGLSQKRLADILGIDKTTLAGWERREHQPTKRFFNRLNSFLKSYPLSASEHKE